MKILFITHKFYPDIGGIEINSEILANSFYQSGHEIQVITWTRATGVKKFPYKIFRSPDYYTLFRKHSWADLIYENNPALRLSWPALLYGKPSVIALRTMINRQNGSIGWQDKLKYLWLKRAKKVIAVSNAVSKKCCESAIVIGNPYRNELFRRIPEINKDRDFVFLGRLVSEKGVDAAIHAIIELNKLQGETCSLNNFSLTIIGKGPQQKKLQKLVEDHYLDAEVIFTGGLEGEDLVSCLNRHKYILVPSIGEETFGNVVLEAMACGCIPIASNAGGLPDAVGEAGLIFERGNLKELISCIIEITNNGELNEHLKKLGIRHLTDHTQEIVSDRYLRVIESAINQEPSLY